jgi:hypothetical protein
MALCSPALTPVMTAKLRARTSGPPTRPGGFGGGGMPAGPGGGSMLLKVAIMPPMSAPCAAPLAVAAATSTCGG